MREPQSPFTDVVVRVMDSRESWQSDDPVDGRGKETKWQTRFYDAMVYSATELPALNFSAPLPPYAQRELAGLTLRGVEKVGVAWWQYLHYLSSFIGSEKAAASVITCSMFIEPTTALKSLLSAGIGDDRPTRVWWSCDSNEIASLPWELMLTDEHAGAAALSFVRGLPPSKTPTRIPVAGKLRLAFIHARRRVPAPLLKALADLPHIEVVPMCGPPRKSLVRAVKEGFELIHLVTEGTVSLSSDGVLYFPMNTPTASALGPIVDVVCGYASRFSRFVIELTLALKRQLPEPITRWAYLSRSFYWMNDQLYRKLDIETFTPRELSALLRGSRVGVVSLSAPDTTGSAPDRLDGVLLPKVYRAFGSFGGSALPLPNIVAPLGAMSLEQTEKFWREFYTRLADADCYSAEGALEVARKAVPLMPVALFLRQKMGRDFAPVTEAQKSSQPEPTRVQAELQATEGLLSQLESLDRKYEQVRQEKFTDRPSYKQAAEHRTNLQSKLSSWEEIEGAGNEQ